MITIITDLNNADVPPLSITAMTRCLVLCVGQSHFILGSPGVVVTRATDIISISNVKLLDGTICKKCSYRVGIPLVKNACYDNVLMCTCCCLDYNMCN